MRQLGTFCSSLTAPTIYSSLLHRGVAVLKHSSEKAGDKRSLLQAGNEKFCCSTALSVHRVSAMTPRVGKGNCSFGNSQRSSSSSGYRVSNSPEEFPRGGCSVGLSRAHGHSKPSTDPPDSHPASTHTFPNLSTHLRLLWVFLFTTLISEHPFFFSGKNII